MADDEDIKPPKRVVGIQYDPEHGLPMVILKGVGEQADEIIRKGESLKGRPHIIEDEPLSKALYKLPMDTEIGPELFELVAAVLAHVYAIDAKMEEKESGRNRN